MSPARPDKPPFESILGIFTRFGVLGSAQIVGSAIGFLTVVLITRTGGAATFGQVALAVSVLNYALVVSNFGTNISGVAQAAARPDEIPLLLPAIIGIRLFFATISYIAILLLGPFLAPDWSARLVLYIVGASVFASALFPTWLPQGMEKLRLTAITLVGPFALAMVFSAVAAFTRPEAWAFALARLASDVLMAAFLTGWAWKFFASVELDSVVKKVKWLLKTSGQIAGSQLIRGLSFLSDVVIVGWFVNDAALGHFSAAQRIYLLLTAVSSAYFVVLYPRLAKAAAQSVPRVKHEMVSSIKLSVPGAAAVAILVALGAPFAMPLAFGPEFEASVLSMQLLGAAAAIAVIHRTLGQTLLALDRSSLFLLANTISTATGILLKIVATQTFGFNGTSAAVVAGELIMLGVSFWFVRKALVD